MDIDILGDALRIPVVLIIFKRPDLTRQVLDTIRKAKPYQLFVIADGPREHNKDDVQKCAETRAIIDLVDWDCKIQKNYSEINLGCARRVSSGLDWVFEQVETAIILEDDCIPDPTFFPFCEKLLERYRFDDRISSISAQNFFPHDKIDHSYYFSRYPHCWGWATWRRAWQHFDFEMKLWPEVNEKDILQDILSDSKAVKTWTQNFQSAYDRRVSSWGYRWVLACWLQNSLSIHPRTNLVTNIGFGDEATNTVDHTSSLARIKTEAIEFPLAHPPFTVRHLKADNYTQKDVYEYGLSDWLMAKLKRLIG